MPLTTGPEKEGGSPAPARPRFDKTIARNVAFVSILQLSNYALGFLTVPYLARILGVEKYGILAFSISVNAYLWMLIDWGFTLSATKHVARNRDDPTALRNIFWTTISAKACLAALGLASLAAVSFAVAPEHRWMIIIGGGLTMVGSIFQMEWFARGLEAMGKFTTMAVTIRVVGALLTFVLIRKPEDLWLILLLQGVSGLFVGVVGYWYIQREWRFAWLTHSLRQLWGEIWDTRHYFLSQSATIGYVAVTPLILSSVAGAHQVGLYAGADKIVRVALMALAPVNIAIYPRINALMASNRNAAARLAALTLAAQTAIGLTIALAFYFLAQIIIRIVMGSSFAGAVPTFQVLALIPLFGAVNGVFNTQFLLPLGHKDDVSRISVGMFCLYVPVTIALGWKFGALGAAMALILAECATLGLLLRVLWRKERDYCLAAFRLGRN